MPRESWRGLVHGEKIKHLSFQISFFFFFKFSLAKNQRDLKRKKSSTGKKVRLKGYTVIYHQGLYSLGHFAVMLEVSRIPSAYDVRESEKVRKENSSLESKV